jgi:hypothetical protein
MFSSSCQCILINFKKYLARHKVDILMQLPNGL